MLSGPALTGRASHSQSTTACGSGCAHLSRWVDGLVHPVSRYGLYRGSQTASVSQGVLKSRVNFHKESNRSELSQSTTSFILSKEPKKADHYSELTQVIYCRSSEDSFSPHV